MHMYTDDDALEWLSALSVDHCPIASFGDHEEVMMVELLTVHS